MRALLLHLQWLELAFPFLDQFPHGVPLSHKRDERLPAFLEVQTFPGVEYESGRRLVNGPGDDGTAHGRIYLL